MEDNFKRGIGIDPKKLEAFLNQKTSQGRSLPNIYDNRFRTEPREFVTLEKAKELRRANPRYFDSSYKKITHPVYGEVYRNLSFKEPYFKGLSRDEIDAYYYLNLDKVGFEHSKERTDIEKVKYLSPFEYDALKKAGYNPLEWSNLTGPTMRAKSTDPQVINQSINSTSPITGEYSGNITTIFGKPVGTVSTSLMFINQKGDVLNLCALYPEGCVSGDAKKYYEDRQKIKDFAPTEEYKKYLESANQTTLNPQVMFVNDKISDDYYVKRGTLAPINNLDFQKQLMLSDPKFKINPKEGWDENLERYYSKFSKSRNTKKGNKYYEEPSAVTTPEAPISPKPPVSPVVKKSIDNLNEEYKEQFVPKNQSIQTTSTEINPAKSTNIQSDLFQPTFKSSEPIEELPFTLNRSQPVNYQGPTAMTNQQLLEPVVQPPVSSPVPTQPAAPVVTPPPVPPTPASVTTQPVTSTQPVTPSKVSSPTQPAVSFIENSPLLRSTPPLIPEAESKSVATKNVPTAPPQVNQPSLVPPTFKLPNFQSVGFDGKTSVIYPDIVSSDFLGGQSSGALSQLSSERLEVPKDEYISGESSYVPFSSLDVAGGRSSATAPVLELQKPVEKKQPLYSPQDWVIAGLMGANAITGRQSALRREQDQANLIREMGQRPTYYAGYYDNAARTTIGRNQGLITASHGALIPSTETGLENALVERGEYLVYPDGEFREVGGEKHSAKVVNGKEVGGTETILPEGTMVFSQKLKVPGTNKPFAEMAKFLSRKVEEYIEKMNKVGIAKVDKDTAELMFNRTVKSLNELFELQQSVNGNHGEDYVDTVDPETGEGGEMPIAGNGMIKYGNAGLAGNEPNKPVKPGKPPKVQPPDNMYEIWQRVKSEENVEIKAAFNDLLKKEGININDENAFKAAANINRFLIGLDKYERLIGDEATASDWMDRNKGNQKRIDAISRYLESDSFKALNLSPDDIPIFKSGVITKKDNKYVVNKSKIKKIEDFLDPENIGKYQGIYRGLIRFNDNFGKNNPKYEYNYTPTGVPDQTMDGRPISPVDKFLGNTTIDQTGNRVFVYPEYEEPESKEPPVTKTDPTGSTFTQATSVRPSKYIGRPYDIKQAIPNVLAMSQEVAPYVIPEVQDIRVSPYETYIDPAVQDQYSAAMAASSYGADPNAMFINATQNVMKMQAEKRNQDANIDYQTRMQNANFERQADSFNAQNLGTVNNTMLNVAKSNKAESDINAIQNMIQNYAKYQANEAVTAMKFPLVSQSADFNANTLEYTVIPEYQRAMMNFNPTLLNQEGFFIPDATEIATATKEKSGKKGSETDWQAQAKKLEEENKLLRNYYNTLVR